MKISFVKSIEPYIKSMPASAEVGAGMRYTLNSAKIGKNLYTTSANTCSGFVLNAGRQNFVGHIQPEGFNPKNFAKAFEHLVKDFQDKYGEVKAFVFGGRESSFLDPHCSTSSTDVYATICEVLSTKCNIPDKNFGSVLGKLKGVKTYDDVAVIGDRIYMANKAFEKAKPNEVYEEILIPDSFLT